MGFDETHFIDDFDQTKLLRKYITDQELYESIVERYESKKANEDLFIMSISMQNHGGYTEKYPNFNEQIRTLGASYSDANQYLSLLHESDKALEYLISYFQSVDDPVEIVFFGDHQPNDTVASVVENGAQAETQKRYLVPYLVWSNYGIEGAKDKNTSLNYLAAQVLTAAGVPTNAYQNYLLSLSKTYPVISAAGQTKGIGADEKQLQTYKKLQYYQLFEKNKEKDE